MAKKSKKSKGRSRPSTNNTQNNENASPSPTASLPTPQSLVPLTQATNGNPLPPAPSPSPSPSRGIRLTAETAVPGRIVWIPPFAPNSIALEDGKNKGADNHPAVIVMVDPPPPPPAAAAAEAASAASPPSRPTVQVLPITSWGGMMTAEEKWSKGSGGVSMRRYYLRIMNEEQDGGQQAEDGTKAGARVLKLRDGKRMRHLSYVSLRGNKIRIEVEGLDLFTNNGDAEMVLDEQSARYLLRDHNLVVLENLNM